MTDLLRRSELAVPACNDHMFDKAARCGADRGQRNEVMRRLAERDIETRPGTHAVHRLGFYAKRYGYRPQDFPNAALCEDTTITLPLCPGMSDADQHQVVETLAAALRC